MTEDLTLQCNICPGKGVIYALFRYNKVIASLFVSEAEKMRGITYLWTSFRIS